MRTRAHRITTVIGLVAALAGGFALGLSTPAPRFETGPPAGELTERAPASGQDLPVLAALPDFREVARRTIPSVVTVRSRRTIRVNERSSPFLSDPFGQEFLERFFGRRLPEEPRERRYEQQGLGSGVILSADGYILTNNHVVEGSDAVEIVTADRRTLEAEILGTDPQTDIAVLKVEAEDLPAAALGDSDDLEVGEWVLAVGNPFSEALGHTVTAGIVSAKGRANLRLAEYEDFIQTDAAINPGNSGGALVNTRGQVIGINTAIASQTGGYQGVGFAIPINMAQSVMEQLVSSGRVVRGHLGVSIQDLTPDLAEGMGVPGREGALVASVQEGTPAAAAGLERGDVITAVEGKPVTDTVELRNRIASTAPGTEVRLKILRNGEERSVRVTLDELPGSGARASSAGGRASDRQYGFSAQELSPALASRLGYQGDSGVVISEVEPGGAADRAGLRQGDLVKEVNRRPVENLTEFREAVGAADPAKVLLLLVRRGNNLTYVPLRP